MTAVTYMIDNSIFDGFESVWERVTATAPDNAPIPAPEAPVYAEKPYPEQKRKTSAARRFLPFV